jgi:hypothetical protein
MSELTFVGGLRPALTAGDYEISVAQKVSLEGSPWGVKRSFQVAGERFSLPPTAVRAVFPPDGSLGDHTDVLPHVVLDRATLPWERLPGTGAESFPWLVLLVFGGAEQPEQRTVTLGTLANGPATMPAPVLEAHQQPSDPVNVIDVPRALLAQIMPSAADLEFLAHVRRGGDTSGDTAVVLAGRLPAAGLSSTAHLVSVEGRYSAAGFTLGSGDQVRLVTLASWRFACVDGRQTFPELARALADEGTPLRMPPSGDPGADAFLAQGYVPVRPQLRQGGRTVSWYRGPLVTGPPPADPPPAVRTPDALLRYHPGTGMFDTGRAAAWQLGRLVMLQHTTAATGLYGWKRRRAQLLKRADPAGHPLAVAGIDDDFPAAPLAVLTDLARLRGVPLRYLVPDERLLPAETVRFFQLDADWLAALLDGAYSIGRLTRADARRDQEHPPPVTVPQVGGVLIRSQLISGYPDLLIDAYPGATTDGPLTALRAERLTDTIMLCLFEGVFGRLDLHQRPEALHFAVELPAAGRYGKTLRDASGGQGPATPARDLGPGSTVPVAALAADMATALGTGALHSGDFARQMIETAERVTFLRSGVP